MTRTPLGARQPRARRTLSIATVALLAAALVPTASAAAPSTNPGASQAAANKGASQAAASKGASQACVNRDNNTYDKLLACVTADGAYRHLEAFQAIADAHGGTRASGTPGYDASAEYVADRMRTAGYDVTVQEFEFPYFEELSPATLTVGGVAMERDVDFITMSFSGSGEATGQAVAVDVPPTGLGSGCEAADFAGFPEGAIAVTQRGGCNFSVKAANAEAAGAAAAFIFNQPEGEPVFAGTLGGPGIEIPVLGLSWDAGQAIISSNQEVTVTTDAVSELRDTVNVFAETRTGRDDNVVMVGAHLDSVVAGPGINDNGSGSAALIEVAEKLRKTEVENKVRFAWWGAEEVGLVGSNLYTAELVDSGEIDTIALYLNFDMIASPNYVRFIYDGDGSAFELEGPEGSEAIENLYEDFYGHRGLAWEPTQISFRSDYAGFFFAGVPFGGVFTGAEGIKTPEEAAIYGGTAGEWYDPCYHRECDDIDNLSMEVFDLNIDAIAFSVLTYAYSTETVNGEVGRDVPGKRSDVFGSRVGAPPGAGQDTHSGGGGLHPERDPDHDHDHGHDHDHDHHHRRPEA